jgi:hypothetical protein
LIADLLVRPALELVAVALVQDYKEEGRSLVYTCAAGTTFLW